MTIKFIDFTKDYKHRKKEYLSAIERVLESGYYILGKEVNTFEKEFAQYLGAKYCIGVANGLEAIQISLMALNIGEDDEVITTPLSAVATTLAILAVGAKPIFIDTNKNGQINPDLIGKAFSKKTRAVLAVDLYGQPADVVNIKSICKKHKIYFIEDAAQAHGSTYKNKKLGTYGDIGCFSFYPTKNLGAIGDGGAITTNNKGLAEVCRQIRDYGQKSKYKHVRYGLNSRLDELQASILREKLKFLDGDIQKRLKIAQTYIDVLSGVRGLELVLPNKISDSNFHLFVLKTNRQSDRDKLKQFLQKSGIPTLVHYPTTIPDQPMFFGKYKAIKIPAARTIAKSALSLPCHPFLKIADAKYIATTTRKYFQ